MRPSGMLSWTIGAGLVVLVAFGASGQRQAVNLEDAHEDRTTPRLVAAATPTPPGQVASEEEAMQVAEKRSETMKSMGASMRTLKRFVEGRGTKGDAWEAADVISSATRTLPSLFPAGTGMAALPDSESKEIIWEEWDEFVAGVERLSAKVSAVKVGLTVNDSDLIAAAFGDLGKIGCGGCHRKFREKRDG